MKVYVVIASVSELLNVSQFKSGLAENTHEIKVIMVDESREKVREVNKKIPQGSMLTFTNPTKELRGSVDI